MEFVAWRPRFWSRKSTKMLHCSKVEHRLTASALGADVILQVLKLCQVWCKANRQLIVHVLKLLTNKNGECSTKRGYGALQIN